MSFNKNCWIFYAFGFVSAAVKSQLEPVISGSCASRIPRGQPSECTDILKFDGGSAPLANVPGGINFIKVALCVSVWVSQCVAVCVCGK